MRRKRRILIAAAASVLPLLAVAAGTARADTVTTISQLRGFHQMVVDTSVSPGYIFMAGADSIVVSDLSGNYITALDSGDGAAGIALSPDGSTLYAALTAGTDADSIAAITVSTVTASVPAQTTYPLGAGNVPYGLAVQSGKVWVSYNDGAATDPGAIGDVDLTAGTFEPQTTDSSWPSPPDLAADPSDTGVLVAAAPGVAPATAETFSTTTDPATPMAAQGVLGAAASQCSDENQLAVVPGGAEFIAACTQPQNVFWYSTSDLSGPQGQFNSGSSPPGGVAVDADGMVAVGSHGSPSAIYVYKPDGTLANIFTLDPSSLVGANGLAWEDTPAGPQLTALTQPVSGSAAYSLDVFDQPALTRSTLTISGPSSAPVGRSMTLTGTFAFSTGSAPAGTKLVVTRTVSGSTAKKQFTVPTGPGGTFQLTDKPASVGSYTYAAAYAGDPATGTGAASASQRVSVVRAATSLTLTTGGPIFVYEPTIHVTARLSSTLGNRTVSIYAQPLGSKGKTLLETGRVSSSGELAVTYRARRSTVFSAVFSGDPQDTPRTVTRTVFVQARVTGSVSGYYASKHVGGVLYRLYHSSAVLHAAGSVAPDKHGQCLQFEVQEHFQGAWRPNAKSPCLRLSKASQAFQDFGLNQADIGFPYRVRADYLRSASDQANLSGTSAWLYLMVTT